MFVPRSTANAARRNRPLAPSEDATDPVTQNPNLQPQGSSNQWTSINPQPTVTPRAFQKWPADSHLEDASAMAPPGQTAASTSQNKVQLLSPRVEVAFKVPLGPLNISRAKPLSSLGIPSTARKPTAPKKQGSQIRPNFTSKNPQRSSRSKEQVESPAKDYNIGVTGSFKSIEESTDYIFSPPGLKPVYQKLTSLSTDQVHTSPIIPPPGPSWVSYLTKKPPILGQTLDTHWRNPSKDLGVTTNQKNTILSAGLATPPGPTIASNYPGNIGESGDAVMSDNDKDPQPPWAIKSTIPQVLITHNTSNDRNNKNKELDYDFNLKAIKKTVNDALSQLDKIQIKEPMGSQINLSAKLQKIVKIIIIKELLNWVPTIHLAALGIEHTGNLENAHKCLMYAAKTIKMLDNMGNNYDLEDLEYDATVNLRSENNKVIKEWKNVAGYEPYGILVWIWRDLCLSILLNDDLSKASGGGALVARFLDDIKGSIPLETYDFRRKKEILSFWDLFLTGGSLLTTRKGNTLSRTKAPEPMYWSGSFIEAKKRLDHLYCVNRLNELQKYPSVDLYRTVKSIFPDKYKKEPLETVKGCKASSLEAQIDIFVFERATQCLERLLEDKLLDRSSKRFRDVLTAFSSLKKSEADWAKKQMLVGFEKEVEVFSRKLLKIFPNIHPAIGQLGKRKGTEGDTKAWFLENARVGYIEDSYEGEIPKVDYGYNFAAYLRTALSWNGGPPNPRAETLFGDMSRIFLSKLGIIYKPDKWVGNALIKGTYQAPELRVALEYLLGNFGFERILEADKVAATEKNKTKKESPPSASRGVASMKRKRVTKNVSRGIAVMKAKGAKRPIKTPNPKGCRRG